ncbi:MAG TPA: carboxypeptidase-like regulatory domain-containing protein, partial [Salinivirga sp.]|uniref:carboxypeptidase-like regulatory domain-containing protein n=1 Tax=Salinivirga sp. TaxID=1970192 RepID=UPI002B4A812E
MNWIKKSYVSLTGIIILVFFSWLSATGQQKIIVSPQEYDGLTWSDFSNQISENYNVRFFYGDDLPVIEYVKVSDSTRLEVFLQELFNDFDIYVANDGTGNYFFIKENPLHTELAPGFFKSEREKEKEPEETSDSSDDFLRTNKDYASRTIVIGSYGEAKNGKKSSVYGFVKSAEDGEPVVGSYVYIEELGIGAGTTGNGYYAISVPKGKHVLTVSSIDRKKKKFSIDVRSDGQFDISLERRLVALNEVVVTSDKYHNVRSTNMGLERLTIRDVKEIPQVLGESDLLKVALLLPGVQNAGEASSGFNVRGSPSDQTQFFINNVPVYNTSHLFGFFSAFNPDAVKEFKLYKSNIPAEFGGRLASVFDISTKKGNRQEFSASGGISPVTGRLFLETPIQKDKSSAFIGLRSTYSDWLLSKVKSPDIRNSKANFRDGIGSV